MVEVSVIIPAYNVEKYLAECINSVLSQKTLCEIIIVDDGSTDNTLAVASSFAEKYPFIKVFSQENGGQSTARNKGLKHASGEYVLFLDSDDYLLANALDEIYAVCVEKDLSLIRGGWLSFCDEDKDKRYTTLPKTTSQNTVIDSKTYFCELVKAGYHCVMSCGLIKRSLLTNFCLTYYEGIQYEDNLFALQLLLSDLNAKVMQTDVILTAVRLHSGTTTSSKPKLKKITDILTNVEQMNKFISSLPQDLIPTAKKTVSSLVFAMTSIYFRLDKKDRKSADKLIPKKVLQEAVDFPYDSFQRKKVYAFLHFRPLLRLYQATLRKIIDKNGKKKRFNG